MPSDNDCASTAETTTLARDDERKRRVRTRERENGFTDARAGARTDETTVTARMRWTRRREMRMCRVIVDDPGVSLERFFILSVAPRASCARRARDE